jgi:DNA polymerase elongation subunit (family B)
MIQEIPPIGLERIEYFYDVVLPNLRICSLDIETIRPDRKRAFPDPGQAMIFITQYVIHDGFGNVLQEGEIVTDGKIPHEVPREMVEQICVAGSREHIEKVDFLLDSFAVHFIAGHNVIDFDYKHLRRLGLQYRCVPFDTLKIARYHNRLLGGGPEGRVPNSLLDLKSICYHKRIISSAELPEIDRASMLKEWETRQDEVIAYSRIDRKMTFQLVKETFPPALLLSSVMDFGVYQTITSPTGALSEYMAMRKAESHDLIIPRRFRGEEQLLFAEKEEDKRELSLQAAIVLQPVPGVYENVSWGDFSSLYPSIFVRYNICPTTICCEHEDCKKNNSIEIVLRRGGKGDFTEIKYNVWFCLKKKGIYPAFIEEYRSARMELKRIKKLHDNPEIRKLAKVLDIGIKIPANSCFGQLASRYGRVGTDIRCSAAITAWGRKILTRAWKEGDDLGFKTIYGDTDSGGICDPEKKVFPGERVITLIQVAIQKIFGQEIVFDYEGNFLKVGFSDKKKRYVKMDEAGHVSFKGFDEIIKRNTLGLVFRLTLKEIYIRLLKKEDWYFIYEDLKNSLRQKKYIGFIKEMMGREKIEPTDITRQTRVKPPFLMKSKFNRFGFLLVNRELGIKIDEFKKIMASETLKERHHKTYRIQVGTEPMKIEYYEVRGNYQIIDKFNSDDLPHLDSTNEVLDYAKAMETIWYTKSASLFDFDEDQEEENAIAEVEGVEEEDTDEAGS